MAESRAQPAIAGQFPMRPINFLPGPVKISPEVQRALAEAAVSHRAADFIDDLKRSRETLCRLLGAERVAILLGSGTLANDVVAGQLSLLGAPGLILVNGEFGGRLVDHARRTGLAFEVVTSDWGEPLPFDDARAALERNDAIRWLWATHCETATGVLNDIDVLKSLAREYDAHLCLDCMSSIGTVPMDLGGVHLVSCASGKGLASYPGLALVFHDHEVAPSDTLPRYLDLGIYAATDGVPFTTSSNLLRALACSLDRFATPERAADVYDRKVDLAGWLRASLADCGYAVMAPEAIGSPAVISIALPPEVDSLTFGEHLDASGFLLSYRSVYLVARNVIQVCLMSDHTRAELKPLVDCLCAYDGVRAGA